MSGRWGRAGRHPRGDSCAGVLGFCAQLLFPRESSWATPARSCIGVHARRRSRCGLLTTAACDDHPAALCSPLPVSTPVLVAKRLRSAAKPIYVARRTTLASPLMRSGFRASRSDLPVDLVRKLALAALEPVRATHHHGRWRSRTSRSTSSRAAGPVAFSLSRLLLRSVEARKPGVRGARGRRNARLSGQSTRARHAHRRGVPELMRRYTAGAICGRPNSAEDELRREVAGRTRDPAARAGKMAPGSATGSRRCRSTCASIASASRRTCEYAPARSCWRGRAGIRHLRCPNEHEEFDRAEVHDRRARASGAAHGTGAASSRPDRRRVVLDPVDRRGIRPRSQMCTRRALHAEAWGSRIETTCRAGKLGRRAPGRARRARR